MVKTIKKYLPRNKKNLLVTSLIVSCFSFCIAVSVHHLEENTSRFNPLHIFFHDFDFTDTYYQVNRDKLISPDSSITIINLSCGDKKSIAAVLEKLSRTTPTVIGIDYFFEQAIKSKQDSIENEMLGIEVRKAKKLVLGYRLPEKTTEMHDDTLVPYSKIIKGDNETGFINISDSSSKIRKVELVRFEDNSRFQSFAYSIFKISSPGIDLGESPAVRIKYISRSSFPIFESDSVLKMTDQRLNVFEKKIILLGEVDQNNNKCGSLDKHLTPLNPMLAGTTFPDMEGVLIHANILQTMMRPHPIEDVPNYIVIVFALLLCSALMTVAIVFYCKVHAIFHFGIVLIYEPLICGLQAIIAYLCYAKGYYIELTTPYLIFALSPFGIYLAHFIDEKVIDKLLKYFSKGTMKSPSYFNNQIKKH